jgi:enolase
MIIKEISAKKIKDSRGMETIEVSVNGCSASSPSGTSSGKYETPSYNISLDWNIQAINNLNVKGIEILSFNDLGKIESLIQNEFELNNAKEFGANALFALESAILKALAKSEKKELWQIVNPKAKNMPVPLGNAIGGGLHAIVHFQPTFQEFLLIPKGKSFSENYKLMSGVYKELSKILKTTSVGQEGELQTSLKEEKILDILHGFKDKINIGVDIAASAFYENDLYDYEDRELNSEHQISFINSLIEKYNVYYCEDPMDEEDFSGFSKIKKKNLVIGDDLTVTNLDRLKQAIKNKSINAIIVKPNQNGSLIEVKELVEFCKKHSIKTIMSHRAGETLDSAISDYAFAFQTDFVKFGIATKWREANLDRLVEIEKSLR